MRKTLLLLASAALAVLLASGVALAAFPGTNGALVFAAYDQSGRVQIYRMAPLGAGLARLTERPAPNRYPAWSSDGEKIAFSKPTGQHAGSGGGIYVMNADGSHETRLTTDAEQPPLKGASISWFPDRNKVAFVSEGMGAGKPDIFTLRFDPSSGDQLGLVRLTDFKARVWDPNVSPNGKKVAFSKKGALNVLNTDEPEGPGNHPVVLSGNSSGHEPDWSPNGKKIAFTSSVNGVNGVRVVNADGTNKTTLTTNGFDPAWSPDGRKIVFLRGDALWRMNADGSNETELPTEVPVSFKYGDPDWQPLP